MPVNGSTFRYLRHMFNLPLKTFAKMCGYSFSYVAMIETGRKPLTEQAKRRFMQVYSELIKQQMEKGEDVNAKQKINV